jgi:hypothetical protein
MRLKLAIGGQVIASIPLNSRKAANLEYVYSQRFLLTEACAATLATQAETPVYYIEVASKMNRRVRG